MTARALYLLIKLDSIGSFLHGLATGTMIIGVLGSVACVVTLITACVAKSEGDFGCADSFFRALKRIRMFPFVVLPVAILLFLCHALIPSTKQMAAIIVIPRMVNAVSSSETMQKMPGKILKLADDWIAELSPKKEGDAE
jgi:hypothetical protein